MDAKEGQILAKEFNRSGLARDSGKVLLVLLFAYVPVV